ncbi:thiamine-phosphate kinase [Sneathiella sp.]|uniref:thiamine-phosphate kinase n=1 Tax=Sneathiella sp. TaxID=1964365 RepID=UPI003562E750
MTDRPTDAAPGEFDLIEQIFAPLSAGVPGAFNLTDDAAVLAVEAGQELVLTKDAMVAGVHFLGTDSPSDVARKLLRVNLSDLAAMGATPVGYLLAAFWPRDISMDWVRDFARGLEQDQVQFAVGLLGGDTVRTPGPLSLSLTALGRVPAGRALRRKGAKVGDLIVVSGSLGDGALGLLVLQDKISGLSVDHRDWLADRYHLPQPRVALGPSLIGQATACIDISDGLIADVGHICDVSQVGAEIRLDQLPLSSAAAAVLARAPALMDRVLAGGDDYELAFTVPPGTDRLLAALARDADIPLTIIGEIVTGNEVRVLAADGSQYPVPQAGWQHF